MEDVTPQLYEQIEKAFRSGLGSDPVIKAAEKRVKNGKATMMDAWKYSERVSKCASKALRQVLTEENLPNGILYWNISTRTVKPLFYEVYDIVLDMAERIQMQLDKNHNIGLKTKRPSFPEDRMNQFLNKISEVEENAEGE